MSSTNEDPLIMYLVARKSIRMSPPKLAIQVGHAVQMIMEARMGIGSLPCDLDDMLTWLHTGYTKILLGANENQWARVKDVSGLGRTELAPDTENVIAFWPMRKSEADQVLTRLQLLKTLTLDEAIDVVAGLDTGLTELLYAGLPGNSHAGIGFDEQLVQDIANAVLAWKERRHP